MDPSAGRGCGVEFVLHRPTELGRREPHGMRQCLSHIRQRCRMRTRTTSGGSTYAGMTTGSAGRRVPFTHPAGRRGRRRYRSRRHEHPFTPTAGPAPAGPYGIPPSTRSTAPVV